MTLMSTVILKRTINVVARDGIQRFSVKTVAAEARCSEGLIFHYFKTKKDLVERCYQHVCEKISKETSGCEGLPLVFYSICRYMKQNPEEARFCLEYNECYRNDGFDVLTDAIQKSFAERNNDFVSSATNMAVVIGCLYGSGSIQWKKEYVDDYHQFFQELIGSLQ